MSQFVGQIVYGPHMLSSLVVEPGVLYPAGSWMWHYAHGHARREQHPAAEGRTDATERSARGPVPQQ